MERTFRGSDIRCLKGKTTLMVANVLNNNNFIQSRLKISKIKLQIYINVHYRYHEYTLKNIQKGILYAIVERHT